jgi:aminoglycoside phosphotransferase (APT) family kinase protein
LLLVERHTMARIWDAEVVVTPATACRLIDKQFPALAPATATPIGVGWDNTAFDVNGTYVFRFPRREAALLGLNFEIAVLPSLAPRMPLPIPCPEYFGQPDGDYPFPFVGYPIISGRTACSLALTDAQRTQSAAPLGRFLRALHQIEADEAAAMGAVPDFQGKADTAYHAPRIKNYLRELASKGLLERPERFDYILDGASELRHYRTTLMHGDLYVRHLLVDSDCVLCGVIDWGDVNFGDPAADLCIAHSFLPPSAHASFREAYGPMEEDTWRIARFRALAYAATLLDFGHDTGDADLLREGATILRYLDRSS